MGSAVAQQPDRRKEPSSSCRPAQLTLRQLPIDDLTARSRRFTIGFDAHLGGAQRHGRDGHSAENSAVRSDRSALAVPAAVGEGTGERRPTSKLPTKRVPPATQRERLAAALHNLRWRRLRSSLPAVRNRQPTGDVGCEVSFGTSREMASARNR